MNVVRNLSILALAATLAIGAAACSREEGPAEETGRKIDEAMKASAEKMNEAGQKAGEAMQRAGEEIGKAAEKTGEAIEEAAEKAKEDHADHAGH